MRGVVPVTTAARSLAVNETARELAGASLSENTRRAYAGALRRLDRWLDGRRLDDAALAAYLASLYETGRSPAVAGMAAAAVAANGGGSVKGLRDAALLAVMSDAMLRVSEAAALDVADLEAEGGRRVACRSIAS